MLASDQCFCQVLHLLCADEELVVLSLIPVIFRIFLYLYPLRTARRNITLSSTEICSLNESTARPWPRVTDSQIKGINKRWTEPPRL